MGRPLVLFRPRLQCTPFRPLFGFLEKSKDKSEQDENVYNLNFLKEKLKNPNLDDEEKQKIQEEIFEVTKKLFTVEERLRMEESKTLRQKLIYHHYDADKKPETEEEKEFEKQILEYEKQNPNKTRTRMTVVNMKSGSFKSKEDRIVGRAKLQVSPQDLKNVISRPIYNYLQHKFPEENFLPKFDLHHYRYPAKDKPEGIVFFFHDQSKHCGKYAHVAEYFADRGLEVFGFDLPGHGKSTGKLRGYFGTFKEVEQISKLFIEMVMTKFGYQDLPKFGAGICTGWVTILSLAMNNPNLFNGISLTNPILQNDGSVPINHRLVRFLGKYMPTLPALSVDFPSLQPFHDPLLLEGWLRAGLFIELDNYSYYFKNNMAKLKTPVFIAYGGNDIIVQPSSTKEFIDKIEIEDKFSICYDECNHDIYADAEFFPMVVKEQAFWLKTHC